VKKRGENTQQPATERQRKNDDDDASNRIR
jgi:hypothetical protein